MKRRIILLPLIIFTIIFSLCSLIFKSDKYSLDIPSVIEVRLFGYPKNQNGETYGPSVKGYLHSPDLILVCNDKGEYGYIRNSSLFGYSTIEEALASNKLGNTINMYMQDGITVIDTFKLGLN